MTKLFEDFNTVSDKEWIEKISSDLKGKSAAEISKSRPYEGFDLNVFYSSTNTKKPIKLSLDHNWKIGDMEDFMGSVIADPIEHLIRTGNWLSDEISDLKNYISTYKSESESRNIGIISAIYQESGASSILELALTLSHLNEYFHLLKQHKLLKNDVLASLTILVNIGGDYFVEIAKLRSLRILVRNLAKVYNVQDDVHIEIFASNSLSNYSSEDPDMNILRSTTACMSAVLGGCDFLHLNAHDKTSRNWHEFGDRIAKNIQLMMKHEGHFDKVQDAGSGSYYIEWLTREIAEKAWGKFKRIEKQGGLIHCFKHGIIQKEVKEIADLRIKAFKGNENNFVGINKYRNEGKLLPRKKAEPFLKGQYEALHPLHLEDSI